MTTKETAALLTMFSLYWPTFQVKPAADGLPGTIDAWSEFLAPYSVEECRTALANFRGERARSFAPTASEFEGEIIAIKKDRSIRRALLEQTTNRISNDGPPMSAEEIAAAKQRFAGIVASVGERQKVRPPARKGPVLDERHDWQGTFARLENAAKLAAPEKRKA